MNIKFKAKQYCGDLTIESYEIKQEVNIFDDICFYLWHTYWGCDKGMWIEIDKSTLEIIKEL